MKKYFFTIGSLLVFIVVVFYIRINDANFLQDILLAIATSLLIAVFANFDWVLTNRLFHKIASFFAEISFTVYAVHLPFILYFVSLEDVNSLNLELNISSFVIFVTFLVMIFLYCYFIYFLFERNTYFFKKNYLNY